MRKTIITCVATVTLLSLPFAQAATVCDVKTNLSTTRAKLVEMLGSNDKAQQETLKKGMDETTVNVDTALEALLGDAATAEDAKAKLTQFKDTWTAFKETREKEIIPAFQSGDLAKAKELATTVQAERMKAMKGLIEELGGNDCKEDK